MKNEKKGLGGSLGRVWSQYSFIFVLFIIMIGYALTIHSNGNSFKWSHIAAILSSQNTVIVGTIALGMAFVIITGQIDLSVGSQLVLCTGVTIIVFNTTNSILLMALAAVITGALCGAVNGLLVGFGKMPPFVVTLGTMLIYRSLTLSGGNIAQPTRVSGINPGQNIVSGIVDMVRVVDANGMGEDSVAYEVSGGQTAATKKDDGNATPESTPTLKIAKIAPTMISTLAYVSRNIQRTTPLNYQGRVSEGALTALRKKTGGLIVTGDPAATIPEPTGILKAAAIEAGSDVEIGKIDEKTLRTIALKYGGANNVEGGGVLLLNKDDLIAFGDIRGTSEKKAVYEIEFSENSATTGTIKDGGLAVKFCIVDELPALSKATSAAGSYCMAYGKPLAYQLDLFGPYTVEVSRDYKFAEGLLAVMGEAMIGGNVITENGFLRIKKKASAGA